MKLIFCMYVSSEFKHESLLQIDAVISDGNC